VEVEPGSLLAQRPLRELALPAGSLVVAFFHGDQLTIPSGDDHAEVGDEALIVASSDVIAKVERLVTPRPAVVGTIVIAGGGSTGQTVARALHGGEYRVRIIERDRDRASEAAAAFPRFQVLHGDATDLSLLKAEGIDRAASFIAVTGNDDSNLMASLLARDLGIEMVAPLVDRAETFELWQRLGLTHVFSPRVLAYEHIAEYIASGYSANIVSLSHGDAVVVERRLYEASPAAGVTLAEISPPRGLIVGAVVRGRRVFVPRGADRLEVGDVVILFVRKEELATVQLLFPGRDKAGRAA
jgi:trk system potassium uptake protein TrkA